MEIVFTLIVFIALLYFIYTLQKRHVKYAKRVFIGLGLGILFGAIIQALFGADSETTMTIIDWIDIVGRGYVNFLQMLIMPLIFVSLIRAFTQVEGSHNLGKIGAHVLSTLIITVSIAAVVGISSIHLFNLDGATFTQGVSETARIAEIQERSALVSDLTLPGQILSFIPINIFADLADSRDTSTIAVVIFSALVGIAYIGISRKKPEEAATFKKIIDSLHAIVSRLITIVLRLAPYGILALMTKAVAQASFVTLINMGSFLVASYAAIITMFIIHGIILALFKVNPVQYYKKVWNALSFAFISRSSGATLPLTIETQTHALGVDSTTANFAGTFGLSIGQNGCAGIYPATLVAIIAPSVGLDLTNPITLLTIIFTIAVSSFGVAGVGGGATFASLIVFGALGLPVEIIGLMVSIEPVIDMGRTALNVNDSILAGVVAARRNGTFDELIFNDDDRDVSPEAIELEAH